MIASQSGSCAPIFGDIYHYNVSNNTFDTATDWQSMLEETGQMFEAFGALHKGIDGVDYYRFTVEEDGWYDLGLRSAYGVKATLFDDSRRQLAAKSVSGGWEKNPTEISQYLAAGDYYMRVELTSSCSNYAISLPLASA